MSKETLGKARELAKSGNYKEAVKILRGMETDTDELPSALLLLLLCSYQVNTAEELLKKAAVNLKGVELFARRPELSQLAVVLQSKGNNFVAHLMEYCYQAMILAGENDITILGQLERPAVTKTRTESAFSKMDRMEATELRGIQSPDEPKLPPYEFDPIEELDDIKVKFKSGLDNPDISALSAGKSLALDLLTFAVRSDEYYFQNNLLYDNVIDQEATLYPHDYWGDRPAEKKPSEKIPVSGTTPGSVFDNTDFPVGHLTDEERKSRMDELIRLISEEEKALLP